MLFVFLQLRLLSFVLGRPSVIRACDTDVPLPKLPANDLAGDGNGDIDERYQSCLVHLTSILEEAKDKVCPPTRLRPAYPRDSQCAND